MEMKKEFEEKNWRWW